MDSRATFRRAWSTSPFGRRWRERDDEGLSLIEVVTAITILALVMVMTVGPTLTAFATLRRAKIVDVAEAFAESRIEMARQLQFEQVGVVGGSPSGVLDAFEVVEIQGVTLEVTTTVSWVGSNNVDSGFFDGSDGVPGAVDLGANYKWVEISIEPTTGEVDPIVFNTAIAPPYVSNGSEIYGAVTVSIQKHEPVGSASGSTDYPPVYLIGPGGTFQPSPTLSSPGEYVFENVPASVAATAPYRVRLGPSLTDVRTAGGADWRIHPSDLISGTDRVWVDAGRHDQVNVTIYRPAVLVVSVSAPEVPAGPLVPLTRASVILGFEGHYAVVNDVDQSAAGQWTIDEFNGHPLVPGNYTIQVDAPGYVPQGRTNLAPFEVPTGYPTVVSESLAVEMELATTNTAERTYVALDSAGTPIRGVLVEVEDADFGPLIQVTDIDGRVRMNLPINSTPTITFQSPYGHEETVHSPGSIQIWGSSDVTLPIPGSHGLMSLSGGSNGYFTYLATGSGVNWSAPLLPNASGDASVALPGNGLTNQWAVRLTCWADERVAAEKVVTVLPNGGNFQADFTASPC